MTRSELVRNAFEILSKTDAKLERCWDMDKVKAIIEKSDGWEAIAVPIYYEAPDLFLIYSYDRDED